MTKQKRKEIKLPLDLWSKLEKQLEAKGCDFSKLVRSLLKGWLKK